MSIRKQTIAAIASGMNTAGIGIIRLSGPDALAIAGRIFKPASANLNLKQVASHTIHYGFIYDGEEKIDEVLLLWMKGPHTFTAEDTVEIDCHGGAYVMRRVLETVFRAGARPAEPGEFTKRAFLNGRIDLAQAEAVIDVIQAQNAFALSSAHKQLSGGVSESITKLRDDILHEIAFMEAALDDPEHYSLEGYPKQLHLIVIKLISEIKDILERSKDRQVLNEGIKTVILGKPNAGKSSLFNYFAGENKAIVTDIPGTTRDSVESMLMVGGLLLQMIDTAGIRESEDLVEQLGVNRAKELSREADLILFMTDASRELDSDDEEILNIIKGKHAIIILNKMDLEQKCSSEYLHERTDLPVLEISVKENEGLNRLKQTIVDMFEEGHLKWNDEVTLTELRHKEKMQEALESLLLVDKSIKDEMPEDFFTIDLGDAYRSLGEILGEEVGDDVVNRIFSEFCMGK